MSLHGYPQLTECGYGWWSNAAVPPSPTGAPALIPGTCELDTLHGKKGFADEIQGL